jgi:thiol-disulfide isomerase/thioredoxin
VFGISFFRYLLWSVAAALAIAVGYGFLSGRFAVRLPEASPPPMSTLRAGARVDPAWKIRTLDGREVSFGEFQGKVVFVNFWATWCGPCIAELPGIQRLRNNVGSDEIAFVLISFESPAQVKQFADKRGLKLPLYTARGMPPRVFASAMEGVPVTFVINRKGEVVAEELGSVNWATPAWRDFLRSL